MKGWVFRLSVSIMVLCLLPYELYSEYGCPLLISVDPGWIISVILIAMLNVFVVFHSGCLTGISPEGCENCSLLWSRLYFSIIASYYMGTAFHADVPCFTEEEAVASRGTVPCWH